MAGIQISGLASGINWNSIISEIVSADSAGMNQVQAQQTTVNNQISALGSLSTDLTNLSSAIFSLEDPSLYDGVTAASTTSGSTWQASGANGTPLGSYAISVSQLASTAQLNGASGISNALSSSSDVSGLTVGTLPIAQAVTPGTFSVDGKQITVSTSESLSDVFAAISTATGGAVTASYLPGSDQVQLSSSTPIVLGAANDSSNFLSALKLFNGNVVHSGDTYTISSASTLGTAQLSDDIVSANLKTALTGQDGSGNGSFTVNGVAIDYNINTDTLGTLLARITNSGAGVTATYDANDDQVVLTNNSTGNTDIAVSDVSGNLGAALGLTDGTLAAGTDAQFTINGGAVQTSASNTLSSTALGVQGLSVTVDSIDTQTIQVSMDTSAISTAIQGFITAFNQLQTDIGNDTQVNINNGSVSGSILSSDPEVADWASSLQMTAFGAGSQLTGAITSLDSLGIDFNGTSGQLSISDQSQLTNALTQNPSAVAAFFQTATTGFGSIMNNAVNDIISQNTSETDTLQGESTDLGNQITTMQTELTATQNQLETEFQEMETMYSQYQSESEALSGLGSGSSTSTSSSSSSGLGGIGTNVNDSVSNGTSSTSSTSSTTSTSG